MNDDIHAKCWSIYAWVLIDMFCFRCVYEWLCFVICFMFWVSWSSITYMYVHVRGARSMDYLIYRSILFAGQRVGDITICCKGLTIWAKSSTNLCTKLIVPMNDCIPFLLWGKGIYSMALILSGSREIPFLETTWPSSFPSITANTHFLGFSEIPYFRQRSKICFKWNACYSLFF